MGVNGTDIAVAFFDKIHVYIKQCTQMKMLYLTQVSGDFRGALYEFFSSMENIGQI
jgi:hypothetical protein